MNGMAEQNGQEALTRTLTSDNVLIETNAYQTPVTEELLKSYPKEVWEQFMEFVSSVPFIRNLISPERKRAKDLPRDDKGRIIVDLVNPHILENMDYFRQSALHFQKYGCYTKLKPNSNPNSPFRKWLNEEVRRCWEGMVRPDDGEWVTGYMYFYLNYCPIMLTKTKDNNSKVGSRVQGFPEPWEGVYWRFHYLEQARYGGKYNNFEGGEYAVELSKRGSGKSFSLAGIAAHNFILGESAEARSRITTFIIAANSTYLSGTDGTLTKFVPNIDFCRKHTQFPGHRVVDSPNKVSWVMGYKDRLTGVRSGSLNSVSGIAVDNDPEKVRGKRGNLLWEEFGSFPNFIDTFNIAEYGMKEGGVQYGFSYALGTAGDDDSDFFGAQEILYNPIGYDVYSLPNVWDKPNQGRPHFAFFFPAYVNIKGRYNKDGVSDVVAALLFLLSERYKAKYQTGDPKKIIKVTAEMPITPAEAIIRVTASRFPVTDLMERLMQIDSNPRFYDNVYCGEITINSSGEPEFKPTSAEPIRFFPHKDNKGMAGAVEIFEMPEKDKETGKQFANRYIAGADPYDDDSSGTTSLGSIFILDSWTDRIVAEYTGRPRLAEEFYEICRRLCMFYDARLNYENDKKGLFSYFSKMHSVYLLTDTLKILRDKQMIKAETFGNTSKGTKALESVNNYGRELIERYLLEQVTVTTKGDDGKETETMIPRLFTLRNRAYIQELASWNPQGNFDRVSANIMLMLLREDRLALYGGHTEKYTPPEDPRANDDYFKNNFDKRFGLDAPQHPLDDYDGLGPFIDFSSLNR
jgi:hypothetical protein